MESTEGLENIHADLLKVHTEIGQIGEKLAEEIKRNPAPREGRIQVQKRKIREKTRAAVRAGKLKKKPCEVDGCNETLVIAHHKTYDDPLDVVWLCYKHHAELHEQLRKEKPN